MKTDARIFTTKRLAIAACFLLLAAAPAAGFMPDRDGEEQQLHDEVDRCLAATKAHPDDPVAWFQLAAAYEATNGDLDENGDLQLAAYDKAIQLKPGYAEALRKRVAIYQQRQEKEKMLADCDTLVRIEPKNADNYVKRGDILLMMDSTQHDKALEDYTTAIGLDPGNKRAYYGRAVIYSRQGKDDEAIADYSKIIEIAAATPPNPRAGDYITGDMVYLQRGRQYLKAGQWEKAVADFTTLIQLGNDYAACIGRAQAYRGLGDNEKALADYTTASQSDFASQADRDFAHAGRAEVYAAMGRNDKALEDLQKAVEAHPNSDDFVRLAVAQYAAGQYDESIKNCTAAIETCDAGASAYDMRGAARAAKGDSKKAEADFKKAVRSSRYTCGAVKWGRADDIDELAAAEARLGEYDLAVIHEKMALKAAHGDSTGSMDRKAMTARLALYQQKKPWLIEKQNANDLPKGMTGDN